MIETRFSREASTPADVPIVPSNQMRALSGINGFTLLELMVSMAILSLLVVLLLSVVDNATTLWRQSENRVDAYREARAALNIIADDLGTMYPSSNNRFFYVNNKPKPFSSATAPQLAGTLFFVSSVPRAYQGQGEKSDLCTIGYFAGYDRTSLAGGGDRSMNLYRYFRGSNKTYEAMKDNDLAKNMAIQTSPTSDDTEPLARNVTEFRIDAFSVSDSSPPVITPFVQSPNNPLPDMLEITLSTVSNDIAKRLTDLDDWTDTNSNTIRQNSRTFTKRVNLPKATIP